MSTYMGACGRVYKCVCSWEPAAMDCCVSRTCPLQGHCEVRPGFVQPLSDVVSIMPALSPPDTLPEGATALVTAPWAQTSLPCYKSSCLCSHPLPPLSPSAGLRHCEGTCFVGCGACCGDRLGRALAVRQEPGMFSMLIDLAAPAACHLR